jgi:hypothetical protein
LPEVLCAGLATDAHGDDRRQSQKVRSHRQIPPAAKKGVIFRQARAAADARHILVTVRTGSIQPRDALQPPALSARLQST